MRVAVSAFAKAASNFPSFVPHLERMLELKQRFIACFPPTDTPYDVALDDYEEGMTTAQVTEIFERLKPELIQLIDRHRGDLADDAAFRGPFSVRGQHEAGRRVLEGGLEREFAELF